MLIMYFIWFELNKNSKLNHGFKLVPEIFKTIHCNKFFSDRIVNAQNHLPDEVVFCSKLKHFNGKLTK